MLQLTYGVVHLDAAELTLAATRSSILELGSSPHTQLPQTPDRAPYIQKSTQSAEKASTPFLIPAVATSMGQNGTTGGSRLSRGSQKFLDQWAYARRRPASVGVLPGPSYSGSAVAVLGHSQQSRAWSVGPDTRVGTTDAVGMNGDICSRHTGTSSVDCEQIKMQAHMTSATRSVATGINGAEWDHFQPMVASSTPESHTIQGLESACAIPVTVQTAAACKRTSLLSSLLKIARKYESANDPSDVSLTSAASISIRADSSAEANNRPGRIAACSVSADHPTNRRATISNSSVPDNKSEFLSTNCRISSTSAGFHTNVTILSNSSIPDSKSEPPPRNCRRSSTSAGLHTNVMIPDHSPSKPSSTTRGQISYSMYHYPECNSGIAAGTSPQPIPVCAVSAGLLALSSSTQGSNLLAHLEGSARRRKHGATPHELLLHTRKSTPSSQSCTASASTSPPCQMSGYVLDPDADHKTRPSVLSVPRKSRLSQTQQLPWLGGDSDVVCGVCLDLPDAFKLQVCQSCSGVGPDVLR